MEAKKIMNGQRTLVIHRLCLRTCAWLLIQKRSSICNMTYGKPHRCPRCQCRISGWCLSVLPAFCLLWRLTPFVDAVKASIHGNHDVHRDEMQSQYHKQAPQSLSTAANHGPTLARSIFMKYTVFTRLVNLIHSPWDLLWLRGSFQAYFIPMDSERGLEWFQHSPWASRQGLYPGDLMDLTRGLQWLHRSLWGSRHSYGSEVIIKRRGDEVERKDKINGTILTTRISCFPVMEVMSDTACYFVNTSRTQWIYVTGLIMQTW